MNSSDRVDTVLRIIDTVGACTVKQLIKMIDLGTYRNACRIIQELDPYLNTVRTKEKHFYLNKKGRDYIGSVKIVEGKQIEHAMLLTNAYIYFNMPVSWEREVVFQEKQTQFNQFVASNLKIAKGKEVRSDATFKRNGYLHIVEVDNTQSMATNKEKIEKYRVIVQQMKEEQPRLYFFTKTDYRKKQLIEWGKGLPITVLTFEEIQ